MHSLDVQYVYYPATATTAASKMNANMTVKDVDRQIPRLHYFSRNTATLSVALTAFVAPRHAPAQMAG
jgi:hypothetical protein